MFEPSLTPKKVRRRLFLRSFSAFSLTSHDWMYRHCLDGDEALIRTQRRSRHDSRSSCSQSQPENRPKREIRSWTCESREGHRRRGSYVYWCHANQNEIGQQFPSQYVFLSLLHDSRGKPDEVLRMNQFKLSIYPSCNHPTLISS